MVPGVVIIWSWISDMYLCVYINTNRKQRNDWGSEREQREFWLLLSMISKIPSGLLTSLAHTCACIRLNEAYVPIKHDIIGGWLVFRSPFTSRKHKRTIQYPENLRTHNETYWKVVRAKPSQFPSTISIYIYLWISSTRFTMPLLLLPLPMCVCHQFTKFNFHAKFAQRIL